MFGCLHDQILGILLYGEQSGFATFVFFHDTFKREFQFCFSAVHCHFCETRRTGTPTHLMVNLSILASIASTVVEQISQIRSGQRSLGISKDSWRHTLNWLCRPHLLMARRPSVANCAVSCPILVSFTDG